VVVSVTEIAAPFSGEAGSDHVGRDVGIAKALRKGNPEVDIFWMVDDPATGSRACCGRRDLNPNGFKSIRGTQTIAGG
jgi:hypothetical protein